MAASTSPSPGCSTRHRPPRRWDDNGLPSCHAVLQWRHPRARPGKLADLPPARRTGRDPRTRARPCRGFPDAVDGPAARSLARPTRGCLPHRLVRADALRHAHERVVRATSSVNVCSRRRHPMCSTYLARALMAVARALRAAAHLATWPGAVGRDERCRRRASDSVTVDGRRTCSRSACSWIGPLVAATPACCAAQTCPLACLTSSRAVTHPEQTIVIPAASLADDFAPPPG
jgi:hypothetical protein